MAFPKPSAHRYYATSLQTLCRSIETAPNGACNGNMYIFINNFIAMGIDITTSRAACQPRFP
ncbi:uncharacterized protein RSE6_01050 [Rhynchosporium secalis]|uniref:Uncharacterized protein n=1 Tax=Rhynchosporium secalis TaxID=38038 RepID=A0A1E1LWU9_RHYSE|nr:uncharacterized protein RSE6_01050 [Rhynchosporium secalis]